MQKYALFFVVLLLFVLTAFLPAGSSQANSQIHFTALFPFESELTGDELDGLWSLSVADVDGDTHLDILGAAHTANGIWWWQNSEGNGNTWLKIAIDDNFPDARDVVTADVDGDDDIDVLGAGRNINEFAWWENVNGDGLTWTKHIITTTFTTAKDIHTADIDGDNDLDVIGAGTLENTIAWWENINGDGLTWTYHIVDNAFVDAREVTVADIDGDLDLDVIGAARDTDTINWWENENGIGTIWTEHNLTTTLDGARSLQVADLDQDGDHDILGSGTNTPYIAWWENMDGDGQTWTLRTLPGEIDGSRFIQIIDIENDGDFDIMAASIAGNSIVWWENQRTSWSFNVLTDDFENASSVFPGDFNGDGLVDIAGGASIEAELRWWRNGGGQFRLTTNDTAPANLYPNQQEDVLNIVVTHLGRENDKPLQLDTLELLLEETTGDPLVTSEANELFNHIAIFLDDGSGGFEANNDSLVTIVDTFDLTDGRLTVAIDSANPVDTQVAWNEPRAYFVVVNLKLTPHLSMLPSTFQITHLTTQSTAINSESGEFLVQVYNDEVTSSSLVSIVKILTYLPVIQR